MAHAIQLTIGSSNRVVIGDNAQEVTLPLIYQLESGDTDLMQLVQEKSQEVARAHRRAWNILRDEAMQTAPAQSSQPQDSSQGEPAQTEVSSAMPGSPEPTTPVALATAGQLAALQLLLKQAGWSEARRDAYLRKQFDCECLNHLSSAQAARWLLELQRAARAQREHQRSPRLTASSNGASHKTTQT